MLKTNKYPNFNNVDYSCTFEGPECIMMEDSVGFRLCVDFGCICLTLGTLYIVAKG